MSTKSPGPQIHEVDWLTTLTRGVLFLAQEAASELGMTSIQPEYLLLGVIIQRESKAATLLNESGLNEDTLRAYLQETYGRSVSSKDVSPPLSHAAERCIEQAIAMITYYLMRDRSLAQVTPEHLVLSIISHPHIRKLLIAYPTEIVSLRQRLTENMEPDFLRHIEEIFQHPEHLSPARRRLMNLSPQNKEHVRKYLPAAAFVFCPSCRQQIQPQWKHCAYCGHKSVKKCSKCGTPYPKVKGARFCVECGNRLT